MSTSMSSEMTLPKEVVSISPIIQIAVMDCAVAAVAMLTGHPYSDVVAGRKRTYRIVRKKGAIEIDLRRLAKGVGAHLHKVVGSKVDLDEDTGILWLNSIKEGIAGHAAVLFRGTLIDPSSGLIWNPHVFLAQNPHYEVEALFELA